MNSLEIARMQAIATKTTKGMINDATEKAFLYMLAIPLNVLVSDGIITKDGEYNAEEYLNSVISLYKSVEKNIVTDEQLAGLIEEYTGMKLECEWLKRKDNVDNGN